MDIQEYELQTRFINENMDILHKYLIWKEFISEENGDPQILDAEVIIKADDVSVIEIKEDDDVE